MNIGTLLLRLDDGPLCEARTQFTLEFARRHESHLVGLAATGFPDIPVAVNGAVSLVQYAEIAWRAARERTAPIAETFRRACTKAGVVSFATIVDEAAAAPSIVRHANSADLVILSQPDPRAEGHALERQITEEVVLYGSRPTLLLPFAGRLEPKIGNVMIAWDDSREAARALADALPILRRAKEIRLVSWNEARNDADAIRARMQAVCEWLGRHGIVATGSSEGTPEVRIADAMLSRAADLGADLIVMGAYGHTRWTERVLGGATRGLLNTMTVPVLMSH